jgi:hypothetical protein
MTTEKDIEQVISPAMESDPGDSAEPDYRALVQERDDQIAKLTNDNKALKGRYVNQAERDEALSAQIKDMEAGLKAQMAASAAFNTAVAEAVQQGDVEQLPAKLTEIQNRAQAESAKNDSDKAWKSLQRQLIIATQDDEGNEVLSLIDAPELEGVRNQAYQGGQRGDWTMCLEAVGEAAKITSRILRERREAVSDEEKAKIKKQIFEDNGIIDHDIGTGAGGGGSKRLTYGDVARFNPEGKTPREIKAAGEEVLNQFFRNKR